MLKEQGIHHCALVIMISVLVCITSESDDEDFEPPPASYRASMDRRRKSVFAESYEPGDDDSAVEKVSALVLSLVYEARCMLTLHAITVNQSIQIMLA